LQKFILWVIGAITAALIGWLVHRWLDHVFPNDSDEEALVSAWDFSNALQLIVNWGFPLVLGILTLMVTMWVLLRITARNRNLPEGVTGEQRRELYRLSSMVRSQAVQRRGGNAYLRRLNNPAAFDLEFASLLAGLNHLEIPHPPPDADEDEWYVFLINVAEPISRRDLLLARSVWCAIQRGATAVSDTGFSSDAES